MFEIAEVGSGNAHSFSHSALGQFRAAPLALQTNGVKKLAGATTFITLFLLHESRFTQICESGKKKLKLFFSSTRHGSCAAFENRLSACG